mmetsp:Transcript_55443/g.132477  ORF Transcript_55443/g.132477 Transcript_55443/m.132477 type:complete len:278 (-) Transcript_55443:1618-2451(-)
MASPWRLRSARRPRFHVTNLRKHLALRSLKSTWSSAPSFSRSAPSCSMFSHLSSSSKALMPSALASCTFGRSSRWPFAPETAHSRKCLGCCPVSHRILQRPIFEASSLHHDHHRKKHTSLFPASASSAHPRTIATSKHARLPISCKHRNESRGPEHSGTGLRVCRGGSRRTLALSASGADHRQVATNPRRKLHGNQTHRTRFLPSHCWHSPETRTANEACPDRIEARRFSPEGSLARRNLAPVFRQSRRCWQEPFSGPGACQTRQTRSRLLPGTCSS